MSGKPASPPGKWPRPILRRFVKRGKSTLSQKVNKKADQNHNKQKINNKSEDLGFNQDMLQEMVWPLWGECEYTSIYMSL